MSGREMFVKARK